jgi:hypothetical protein
LVERWQGLVHVVDQKDGNRVVRELRMEVEEENDVSVKFPQFWEIPWR